MLKTFIHNDWQEVLGPEFEKPYYTELHNFLKNEYKTQYIHPDMYHIYEAFEFCVTRRGYSTFITEYLQGVIL